MEKVRAHFGHTELDIVVEPPDGAIQQATGWREWGLWREAEDHLEFMSIKDGAMDKEQVILEKLIPFDI